MSNERQALTNIVEFTKTLDAFNEAYLTIQEMAEKGLEIDEREWCYFEVTGSTYTLIKAYEENFAVMLYEEETGESICFEDLKEVSKEYALVSFVKFVYQKAFNMGKDVSAETIVAMFKQAENVILIINKE